MNTNNLPPGVKYEDTISNPESLKPKTYKFMEDLQKIKPCQGHAFSDEGAESLEELNLELPLKCIHFKDYNLCSCKNICEQCKID